MFKVVKITIQSYLGNMHPAHSGHNQPMMNINHRNHGYSNQTLQTSSFGNAFSDDNINSNLNPIQRPTYTNHAISTLTPTQFSNAITNETFATNFTYQSLLAIFEDPSNSNQSGQNITFEDLANTALSMSPLTNTGHIMNNVSMTDNSNQSEQSFVAVSYLENPVTDIKTDDDHQMDMNINNAIHGNLSQSLQTYSSGTTFNNDINIRTSIFTDYDTLNVTPWISTQTQSISNSAFSSNPLNSNQILQDEPKYVPYYSANNSNDNILAARMQNNIKDQMNDKIQEYIGKLNLPTDFEKKFERCIQKQEIRTFKVLGTGKLRWKCKIGGCKYKPFRSITRAKEHFWLQHLGGFYLCTYPECINSQNYKNREGVRRHIRKHLNDLEETAQSNQQIMNINRSNHQNQYQSSMNNVSTALLIPNQNPNTPSAVTLLNNVLMKFNRNQPDIETNAANSNPAFSSNPLNSDQIFNNQNDRTKVTFSPDQKRKLKEEMEKLIIKPFNQEQINKLYKKHKKDGVIYYDNDKKLWLCTVDGCDKEFGHYGHCKRHFDEKHTDKKYRCGKCHGGFKQEDKLKKHIAVIHLGISKSFRCTLCSEEISDYWYLKKHFYSQTLCSMKSKVSENERSKMELDLQKEIKEPYIAPNGYHAIFVDKN